MNHNTCSFQDVIYLDLVDLDKSPQNLLILEKTFPDSVTTYSCPHYLVTKIANICKDKMLRNRISVKEKQDENLEIIQTNQKEIMSKLSVLEEKIALIRT